MEAIRPTIAVAQKEDSMACISRVCPEPKINTTARGAGQQDAMDRQLMAHSIDMSGAKEGLAAIVKGMSYLARSFLGNGFDKKM